MNNVLLHRVKRGLTKSHCPPKRVARVPYITDISSHSSIFTAPINTETLGPITVQQKEASSAYKQVNASRSPRPIKASRERRGPPSCAGNHCHRNERVNFSYHPHGHSASERSTGGIAKPQPRRWMNSGGGVSRPVYTLINVRK